MSDEISQVVELECRGVYYLVKGSKEMIAMVAKFVMNMADWANEKYLKKPGNISWDKLQKVSEGAPPLLEFPKEMFEPTILNGEEMISPFEYYCEKNNLRYCIMPDLNPNDDYSDFVNELVNFVCANLEKVDEVIAKSLVNYKINRLSYVDRAIIRMAAAEMMMGTAVAVVINEALEIVKIYSDQGDGNAVRFINKVLDNVSKNIER